MTQGFLDAYILEVSTHWMPVGTIHERVLDRVCGEGCDLVAYPTFGAVAERCVSLIGKDGLQRRQIDFSQGGFYHIYRKNRNYHT